MTRDRLNRVAERLGRRNDEVPSIGPGNLTCQAYFTASKEPHHHLAEWSRAAGIISVESSVPRGVTCCVARRMHPSHQHSSPSSRSSPAFQHTGMPSPPGFICPCLGARRNGLRQDGAGPVWKARPEPPELLLYCLLRVKGARLIAARSW